MPASPVDPEISEDSGGQGKQCSGHRSGRFITAPKQDAYRKSQYHHKE